MVSRGLRFESGVTGYDVRQLDAVRLQPLSVFEGLGPPSANISALVALEPSTRRRGLEALRRDLEDGTWASVNRDLAEAEALDAGYRIVICTL